MNHVPVKSTQIKTVGYDSASKKLAVTFNNGAVYHYDEVPPHVHDDLMKADSIGRFFGARIRGHYKHTKQEKPKHE